MTFTPSLLGKAARFAFSPFVTRAIGGANKFRIPGDADQNTYAKALNAIYIDTTQNPPPDIRVPNYVKQQFPFENAAEQRRIYLQDNVQNGSFINNRADNGLVFVDNNMVPVQRVNGETFGLLHDDLKDPTSDAYKRIVTLEKNARRVSKEGIDKLLKTKEENLKFVTSPFRALEKQTTFDIRELSREARE